jgi:sialic acid synthase SpsE
LGASVIEKHFTLSNHLPGPDHGYAVEPAELASLVQAVREVEQSLGDGSKMRQSLEKELHGFARRFLYASRLIKKGERLTADNVSVLRKGRLPAGLEPREWDRVLGRAATRDIPDGSPIEATDCN